MLLFPSPLTKHHPVTNRDTTAMPMLDDMFAQMLSQLPALIRPTVMAFLDSNGLVFGQLYTSGDLQRSTDSTDWRFGAYVLATEPPLLVVILRCTGGAQADPEEPNAKCRSRVITGPVDFELTRVLQMFRSGVAQS